MMSPFPSASATIPASQFPLTMPIPLQTTSSASTAPNPPLCLNHQPGGLFQGDTYYLGYNTDTIAIDENLFANDSHCMAGLTAKTLGVYEKGTGRGVVCDISEFPYTLIWSKPGIPKFVCIEPWHSIPSAKGSDHKWEHKPAAATIAPGENWSTTLSMTFQR